MILLTNILIFWFGSIIIWFPFWIIIVDVIVDNIDNITDEYKHLLYFILPILTSPLIWIICPNIIYTYFKRNIKRNNKTTIEEIIKEIFNDE